METFPSISPSYTFKKIPLFNTYIVDYGKGKEQRLVKRSRVQYRLSANWNYLSASEKSSIESFFIARKGAFEIFKFIDLTDSKSYVVRFEEDPLNIEYFRHLLYRLNSVNFLEVVGPCLRTPAGSIDFGEVTVGNSDNEILTICNDGNTDLYVFDVERILGSSEFTCLTSVPFTMTGGSTKNLTIRFAPTSTGVKAATFNIKSYDPYNPALTFSVTGTGV